MSNSMHALMWFTFLLLEPAFASGAAQCRDLWHTPGVAVLQALEAHLNQPALLGEEGLRFAARLLPSDSTEVEAHEPLQIPPWTEILELVPAAIHVRFDLDDAATLHLVWIGPNVTGATQESSLSFDSGANSEIPAEVSVERDDDGFYTVLVYVSRSTRSHFRVDQLRIVSSPEGNIIGFHAHILQHHHERRGSFHHAAGSSWLFVPREKAKFP